MIKIRTEVSAPEQAANGKWRSCFSTFAGDPGQEYLANNCASAPIWDTEDEAYAAAARALTVLEETNTFPNMCEPW
jgi:hypothetical protein